MSRPSRSTDRSCRSHKQKKTAAAQQRHSHNQRAQAPVSLSAIFYAGNAMAHDW